MPERFEQRVRVVGPVAQPARGVDRHRVRCPRTRACRARSAGSAPARRRRGARRSGRSTGCRGSGRPGCRPRARTRSTCIARRSRVDAKGAHRARLSRDGPRRAHDPDPRGRGRVPGRQPRQPQLTTGRGPTTRSRPRPTAPTSPALGERKARLLRRAGARTTRLVGWINLSEIVRGNFAQRLPRLQRVRRSRGPGLHDRGARARAARGVRHAAAAPRGGQHPAGQRARRSRSSSGSDSSWRACPRGT